MTAEDNAQTAIGEIEVDDPALTKALDDRQVAKGKASEAKKKADTLNEVVNDQIDKLEIDDGAGPRKLEAGDVVRVGRFVISRRRVAARVASFEVPEREQTSIKFAPAQD